MNLNFVSRRLMVVTRRGRWVVRAEFVGVLGRAAVPALVHLQTPCARQRGPGAQRWCRWWDHSGDELGDSGSLGATVLTPPQVPTAQLWHHR